MQIELAEIGKKFNREWVFKDINHCFKKNSVTSIQGTNGSGKSTLLKIISGAELPSKGTITYQLNSKPIKDLNEVYKQISFVGPYMDLPELLTIRELYEFQVKFKPLRYKYSDFVQKVMLENDQEKQIKNYSSGMRQRLKLGLSILSESAIVFLDEPCSNLDQKGIDLFQEMLRNNADDRTIIIGSNEDINETFMATETINIMNYK